MSILQVAWKMSDVTHDNLRAIHRWANKSFEVCGWPLMPADAMFHSQLKQVAFETFMVRLGRCAAHEACTCNGRIHMSHSGVLLVA